MPLCPNCKQKIKYIYSKHFIVPVNPEEKVLFNLKGSELRGYEKHVCDNKKTPLFDNLLHEG